jgi:hypothetical protein
MVNLTLPEWGWLFLSYGLIGEMLITNQSLMT